MKVDKLLSLGAMYAKAEAPKEIPTGRYKVIAGKGVPMLPWHYKRIYKEPWGWYGYNRSIFKWGKFAIHLKQDHMQFDYLDSRIIDHVRQYGEGSYIGKYYRKGRFKGYFLLLKAGE